MWDKQKQSGFTIVELVIVIVVIAILATITVVAYNGIQNRARIAATVQTVQAYYKGLTMYGGNNGSYPNYATACLGEGVGTCWAGNGYPEVAGFNTALKTTMGTLPVDKNTNLPWRQPIYVGPPYGWTIDGRPRAFILYLSQSSPPKCEYGAIVSGSGVPAMTSAAPGNVSYTASGQNECWVPLPEL